MPSNPFRATLTGFSTTAGFITFFPDYSVRPFSVTVACVPTSTAPAFSVQHSYDYTGSSAFVSTAATWFTNTALSTIAGLNAEGTYTFPVTAIRLNTTGGSTATSTASVSMTIIQAG